MDDLWEIGWKVWNGCIWLRTGTSGRLLPAHPNTFGLHKR